MRALVLSGGGSRGAFQGGALDVLGERGERFDAVYGTSIGALNAALVVADPSLERVVALWRDRVDDGLFGKTPGFLKVARWLFNRPSVPFISSIEPIKDLARREHLFDASALRGSPVRFTCFSADGVSGDPVRIDTALLARVDDATALELVFSSALLPGIFAPLEWRDPRDGQLRVLLDGGYSGELVPVRAAIEDGADDVTVITLESPGLYDWERTGGPRPRTRVDWEHVGREALIFRAARRRMEADLAANPGVRARVISPRQGVPGRLDPLDDMDYRRASARAWFRHGQEVAREVVGA